MGTLLGEWHLRALLGVGGSAAVFAATDREGRQRAIKVLHRDLALSAEALRRLQREARLVRRIHHPGVVAILGAGREPDGADFLVLELLDGQSLEQLCEQRGGVLSEPEALRICEDLVDVLGAAHSAGIVHRDVKPSNIFITRSGSVRLLDFGIARDEHESDDRERGTTVGTLRFMAPEQARGHSSQVGPRTDLWAVGATLFRLVSGRHVHHDRSGSDLLITVATTPAPSLRSIRPGASLAVASLVDRALAFDPARRFRSASEMKSALQTATHQCGSLAAIVLELSHRAPQDDETSRFSEPDLPASPRAWPRRYAFALALAASFALVAFNLSRQGAALHDESRSLASDDIVGVPFEPLDGEAAELPSPADSAMSPVERPDIALDSATSLPLDHPDCAPDTSATQQLRRAAPRTDCASDLACELGSVIPRS